MINFPSYYSNTYGIQEPPSYTPPMQNSMPAPMENVPTAPYSNMGMPQSNFPGAYARGGKVNSLPQIANYLSSLGQDEDKILAHINPEEAYELNRKYGSDINPLTGLP